MARPVRQSKYEQRRKKKTGIDTYIIGKYFAMWILFAALSFGVKYIVMRALGMSPTGECGNGMLTLLEVHNTGAAFNILAGQPHMIIMASGVTVALLTFIVLIASAKLSHNAVSSMALLSAGITMNMFERINLGYVIDYIKCDFLSNFPVFNVSDIMIVLGVFGLVLAILFGKKQEE